MWSPWYVGNTMTDLEKKFGKDRVIDTPVSESACTGAACGCVNYWNETYRGSSKNRLYALRNGRNCESSSQMVFNDRRTK